jgi:hypothetical protein
VKWLAVLLIAVVVSFAVQLKPGYRPSKLSPEALAQKLERVDATRRLLCAGRSSGYIDCDFR